VFDRALSFDASLYYIEWKDIQVVVLERGYGYYTNASRAKSQGVELSLESRPVAGLTLAGWVAWNEAELTEAFPASSTAFGISGDRLPFSSRFSASVSLDDEFALGANLMGFAGASVSYVGERVGQFTGTSRRQAFPAYAQTDMRAGVRYDTWTANLFVNNLADRRGVLAGGLGTVNELAFDYIRPRTIGVAVSKVF
jgi:outer membrane receptor protein involved in Fe transport